MTRTTPLFSIAWLFGYRDVPYGSRTIFRHEFKHMICWALVWGSLNTPFCGYVALRGMQASDFLVAIITAAMAFANLFAVWWAAVAHRMSRRGMMTLTLVLTSIVLFSFALTPQLRSLDAEHFPAWFLSLTSRTVPLCAVLFTLQVVVAWVAIQATNMVRTSLWKTSYPDHSRGQVLARFAVWQMSIGAVWVALIGAYFDGALSMPAWTGLSWTLDIRSLPKAGHPDAYMVFMPLAGLAGLLSVWLFRRMPIRASAAPTSTPESGAISTPESDGPIEPSDALPGWLVARLLDLRTGLRDSIAVVRADAQFRRYLMCLFVSGSAVMMVNVPFLLILKSTFEINYATAALLLTFLPQVAIVVLTPTWGRLFDRWPLFYFRAIQIGMWAVSRLILAYGVWQTSMGWVIAGVLASGLALGGGRFAWQLGHLGFSNQANDTLYMGVHQTLTGIRGLIMPFVGVVLFRYVLDWHIIWISAAMLAAVAAGFYHMHRLERSRG